MCNVKIHGVQRPHNLYVWLILSEFIAYRMNCVILLVSLVCDLACVSVRVLTYDELVQIEYTSTVCSERMNIFVPLKYSLNQVATPLRPRVMSDNPLIVHVLSHQLNILIKGD